MQGSKADESGQSLRAVPMFAIGVRREGSRSWVAEPAMLPDIVVRAPTLQAALIEAQALVLAEVIRRVRRGAMDPMRVTVAFSVVHLDRVAGTA